MKEKNRTIIGFGAQAKAWALNLKDSSCKTTIALKSESPSHLKANQMGFKTINLESNELSNIQTFMMLFPDGEHVHFFEKNHSFIRPGSHFIYAHGFSLSKHQFIDKYPQFTHSLLAPKAIASEVRFQYEVRGKLGAVYDCIPENEDEIFHLAEKLGFTAIYKAHYEEETMADLLSEQSILCSLIPYASLKTYNLLRQNKIPKELAFMECFLELKSISEAFVRLGPEEFFQLISPNALIGSEKGYNTLLGKEFDQGLEKLFSDIKSKKFYHELDNYKEIRHDILKRWHKEELTKTFNELKKELIP